MAITVYHGTIYDFKSPLLEKCKDRKDFGKGFYLAHEIAHARDIAKKNYLVHNASHAYIVSYKIDIAELRELGLLVHEFREPNKAWLDFIIKNRNLLSTEDYDVVIGPTADSAAQAIITSFYENNGLNATKSQVDAVIKQLKTSVYGKQYCFRTLQAIDYLTEHYCERRQIK